MRLRIAHIMLLAFALSSTATVSALPIQPLPSVAGVETTSSTAWSPDGRHLYSIAPDGIVTIWQPDAETGALRRIGDQSLNEENGPFGRFLYPLDDQRFYLFSSSFSAPFTKIAVLSRDPATGALTVVTERIRFEDFALWGACDADQTRDGRFLYVSICNAWPGDSSSGAMVTLALDESFELPTLVEAFETDQATAVIVSPDQRSVFVANDGTRILFGGPDVLTVYAREPVTGVLSRLDGIEMDVLTDANPDLALSPDGRHLYFVTNAPRNAPDRTALFTFTMENDELVQQDMLTSDLPGLGTLLDGHELRLTPDGQSLILPTPDHLNVFSRDQRSGQITLDQVVDVPSGSYFSRTTLDPSGSRLYRFNDVNVILEPYAIACTEGPTTRCLDDGRFHLFADWRDFAGRAGVAATVVDANPSSALFTFFAEDNWELLAKTVDGCAANGHFWSFAAATTNVAFRLRWIDTWTGTSRVYENPLGEASAATTDTRAFATCDAINPFTGPLADTSRPFLVDRTHPGDDCGHGNELCLLDARYEVTATWRDFAGRTGTAMAAGLRTDRSGLLWFFNNDNWELLVKMVDGCALNAHTWVFAAGTTNVAYALTVVDTQTGATVTYDNPLGTASPAITDTRAFANCDAP